MPRAFANIAFTPNVLAEQTRQGSAKVYEKLLDPDVDGGRHLGPAEAAFIQARDGFYQATVSETGWPYVQFRGGPVGFLRVMDDRTIGYVDYRGNRQYLSVGNLAGDNRVALILMDYPNRRRLKIWGRVQVVPVDDDSNLAQDLHVEGYSGRPERAIVITIEAMDWNCPAHIPQRLTRAELEPHLAQLHARIAELTAENERLSEMLDMS